MEDFEYSESRALVDQGKAKEDRNGLMYCYCKTNFFKALMDPDDTFMRVINHEFDDGEMHC